MLKHLEFHRFKTLLPGICALLLVLCGAAVFVYGQAHQILNNVDFWSFTRANGLPGRLIGPSQAGGVSIDPDGLGTSLGGDYKYGATTGTLITDMDGATVTFNIGGPGGSNLHVVTLSGNRTLALSNDAAGKVFSVCLAQDQNGSRTVTWWSNIKWAAGGTAPTLTTTASKTDCFSFIEYSSNNYWGFVIGQNI